MVANYKNLSNFGGDARNRTAVHVSSPVFLRDVDTFYSLRNFEWLCFKNFKTHKYRVSEAEAFQSEPKQYRSYP